MNVIEVRGLVRRQGDFTLGPLDLTLPEGCVLGLAGENGAGKTTLIRLILGALERDAGSVSVLGAADRRGAPARVRQDVGFVPDESCFPGGMDARQIGRVMESVYEKWDAEAYAGWLRKFGLPERKKLREYSRGMSMKLTSAVALSHRARLLLLDEATGGLDPAAREELLEIYADAAARDGCGALLSSHIISDLEKICDYVAFLRGGKLLFCEEKDALLDRWGLLKCGRDDLRTVDPAILRGVRSGEYGAEALVERAKAPKGLLVERPALEDVILHLSKEETP